MTFYVCQIVFVLVTLYLLLYYVCLLCVYACVRDACESDEKHIEERLFLLYTCVLRMLSFIGLLC